MIYLCCEYTESCELSGECDHRWTRCLDHMDPVYQHLFINRKEKFGAGWLSLPCPCSKVDANAWRIDRNRTPRHALSIRLLEYADGKIIGKQVGSVEDVLVEVNSNIDHYEYRSASCVYE